jgi:hypothetical protein
MGRTLEEKELNVGHSDKIRQIRQRLERLKRSSNTPLREDAAREFIRNALSDVSSLLEIVDDLTVDRAGEQALERVRSRADKERIDILVGDRSALLDARFLHDVSSDHTRTAQRLRSAAARYQESAEGFRQRAMTAEQQVQQLIPFCGALCTAVKNLAENALPLVGDNGEELAAVTKDDLLEVQRVLSLAVITPAQEEPLGNESQKTQKEPYIVRG